MIKLLSLDDKTGCIFVICSLLESRMSSLNNTNPSQDDENPSTTKIELNQRWFGYLCVAFFSAINFASISNVEPLFQTDPGDIAAIAFGFCTFTVSSLILLQDRSQKFLNFFHFTKSRDGYLEGGVLSLMVIWWIVGVGVVTKPGGIAYEASNIYYSSWASLFSCIYTLDLWSAEKDILSITEITGISCTLKSWWVHCLSACVFFSCSGDADTLYAMALGFASIAISMWWIGVHLDFFSKWGMREGGWLEILSCCFLMFVWIVGVGVFTSDGGVAARMEGDECKSGTTMSADKAENSCSIHFSIETSHGKIFDYQTKCEELPEDVPGSNLYYSCWSCMLSSIAIAFRWKASQALKFAQAQAKRQQHHVDELGEGNGER